MTRAFFIIGLTLSIVSAIFLHNLTANTNKIDDSRQMLDQLSVIDEEIFYTMMMIHAGIVKNFDKLVELSDRHRETVAAIELQVASVDAEQYQDNIEDIKHVHSEKARQLERFKSDTAILNNAKIYIAEKVNLASQGLMSLPTLLKLSNRLMVFAESPNDADADYIRARVNELESIGLPAASLDQWERGKRHLEYYLDKKIDVLSAAPLTVNWVEIDAFKRFRLALAEQERYNRNIFEVVFFVLVLGIVLISCLGLATLNRYLRARQELVELNNSLEEKIAVAVSDIEKSRDAAVRADAAKISFLANMSHEVRTPLNAIIGFSSRLEKRLGDNLDNSSRKAIKSIHANGISLLNFFKDLLELSHFSSQVQKPSLSSTQDIDLLAVCNEITQEFSDLLERKSLSVSVEASEMSIVVGRKDHIERIFSGALNTMIHITKSGKIDCQIIVAEARIQLLLSASGAALNESTIARILDPFAPTENLSVHVENMGVGLSLARQIVEGYSGNLNLSSASGRNTLSIKFHSLIDRPAQKKSA